MVCSGVTWMSAVYLQALIKCSFFIVCLIKNGDWTEWNAMWFETVCVIWNHVWFQTKIALHSVQLTQCTSILKSQNSVVRYRIFQYIQIFYWSSNELICRKLQIKVVFRFLTIWLVSLNKAWNLIGCILIKHSDSLRKRRNWGQKKVISKWM